MCYDIYCTLHLLSLWDNKYPSDYARNKLEGNFLSEKKVLGRDVDTRVRRMLGNTTRFAHQDIICACVYFCIVSKCK